MIGSPASRGAVASLGGGAARACLATASAVSAVSAAIVASATMAGGLQCGIAMPLFNLDARELDHLRPLFDRLREQRAECRGRASERRAAQFDDPCPDPGIGEAGIELLVQEIDDLGRSALRRADAGKTARLIAGHELSHRWN